MFEVVALSVIVAVIGYRLALRGLLSLSKKSGLVGHRRIAKSLLALIPQRSFSLEQFLKIHDQDKAALSRRSIALRSLATSTRYDQSKRIIRESREALADQQVVQSVAAPFVFRNIYNMLPPPPVIVKADDSFVYDADGHSYIDFSNSLSNNLLGYRKTHERTMAALLDIQTGGVLGNYNNDALSVIADLKEFSGHPLVSFHMSGTEAVMQACQLARFNSKKDKIVTFAGAYHGWWDGVQAGLGSTRKNKDSFMLEQESRFTDLTLMARRDIAAVVINPLSILFPNKPAPTDGFLFGKRLNQDIDHARLTEYRTWLTKVRDICTKRGIALVFDEVYTGHRLGWGGAQSYFGVQSDISIYGKSFGGGLPVGVVCANHRFGRRINELKPFDLLLARGTFQGHPYLMAAMRAFLLELKKVYQNDGFSRVQKRFAQIADHWNQVFEDREIPLSVSRFESIFSFNFHRSSAYNWLLPYMLRDLGVYVAPIPGLARVPLPLNFSTELAQLALDRILEGAARMKSEGFWTRQPQPEKVDLSLWAKQLLKSNA